MREQALKRGLETRGSSNDDAILARAVKRGLAETVFSRIAGFRTYDSLPNFANVGMADLERPASEIQPPPWARQSVNPTGSAHTPTSRPTSRGTVTVVGMSLGGGGGFQLTGSFSGAVVGALLGFLVAWRTLEWRSRYRGEAGVCRAWPSALLGLILATSAWIVAVLVLLWVTSRPPGTFHDQGGMLITFIVLPVLLLCWLTGGLVASVAGHYGISQIKEGKRPKSELWLARSALVLSWPMLLMPLAVILERLLAGFSW